MFCPSCGQQQISNETKFCSRCGLPLGVVTEVVSYGGYLPQLAELDKKRKSPLNRRNALGFSLIWLLFWLLILCPLFGIMDLDGLSGASAVIGIFGGLIMMLSTLIFIKRDVQYARFDPVMYAQQQQQGLGGPAQGHALPPQQSIPASAYAAPHPGNWRDTNDLQPTVTEGATRLLDEEPHR